MNKKISSEIRHGLSSIWLKTTLTTLAALVFCGTARAEVLEQRTYAAELQEVRTGSINGKQFLTIHIDNYVGPADCHGKVLRVDTQSESVRGRQEQLETIALSAMLKSEVVMITVPLEYGECVDGMPTLTDIFPLAESFY